jgi:hypothetical protein
MSGLDLGPPYIRMVGFCFVDHPSDKSKCILVALFQDKDIYTTFYVTKEEMEAPGDRLAIAYQLGENIPVDYLRPIFDKTIRKGEFTQIKKLLRESFKGYVWHFVKK